MSGLSHLNDHPQVDLANNETKLQYGMVHLREAVRNVQTPRFEAALAGVAAG